MKPMLLYAGKRLLLLPLMLLFVATFSFLLIALMPGDPAVLILGEFADDQRLAELRTELGLDRPVWEQYLAYLGNVARGDLGESLLTGASVWDELMKRLPNSLVIIIPSLVMAVVLGTLIGTVGGYYRRNAVGKSTSVVISAAQGIPPFFLAIVLIYLFVFEIRIFPTPTGMLYPSLSPPPTVTGVVIFDAIIAGDWAVLSSIAAHAILPVLSTGLFLAAYFAKTVRTGLTQAMASPQVEFARGSGLSEWTVVRYALLSTRTAVLTYLAILFGVMLSATAIIEVVFSWPGIGAWALDGVLKNDIPVIQGFILVTGALVIIAYIVLDVVVAMLDPRITY